MKRLLLNSSNIKPVNIRIVSNGVECADLKMLKENFCISDIKNVLDGRLVNWLSNIGEKDLANKIKEKYPTPDSLNEKEFYLCELFFDNFTLKEYIKVLLKETTNNIFTKEITRLPNLIVEAYNYYPTKYSITQWKTFFDISLGTSDEFEIIKKIIVYKCEKVEKENLKKTLGDVIEQQQAVYLSMYFNSLFNSFKKTPHYGNDAKKEALNILEGYKVYFNSKYEILVKDFIRSLNGAYFYDRISTKNYIDLFIKRYGLKNVKI